VTVAFAFVDIVHRRELTLLRAEYDEQACVRSAHESPKPKRGIGLGVLNHGYFQGKIETHAN
jgi:hypothetical protein